MESDSHHVALAVRGVEPGSVQMHPVIVEGVTFPVNQVFAGATGLSADSFTSQTARRHLATLGFSLVGQVQPRSGQRARLSPQAWWTGTPGPERAPCRTSSPLRCETVAGSPSGPRTRQRRRTAWTSWRGRGPHARGGGEGVWPSKGYADPRRAAEKKRTQPTGQAGHWYSRALMKAVVLLDSHPA